MKVGIPLMTLEELERLPSDGNRYELIEGVLYVCAAPRNKHQLTLVAFLGFLLAFVRKTGLGRIYPAPFDVFPEPGRQTCVEPDILFVAKDRLHIIEDKGVYGAPDLVIEILSESTWRVDLFDKRDLYQRSGVKEYWAADTDENCVFVYRFTESPEPRRLGVGDILTTPLLPGLEIPLDAIFE